MSGSRTMQPKQTLDVAAAGGGHGKAVEAPSGWRTLAACTGAMLALAWSATASAHVVLAEKVAVVGTYYRAKFLVGHGCAGSPTVSLQVDIPDGVSVVRPQPKAGWVLSYETGPLAEPAMVHGKPKTEAIRRVVWTGGPLPDEQYDEFGMMLFLSKPGRLHFRVLQTCESGANDWAGVAVEGGGKPALPAATLDVMPQDAEAGTPPADPGHSHAGQGQAGHDPKAQDHSGYDNPGHSLPGHDHRHAH